MRLTLLAALCVLSCNAFAATTTVTEYRLGEDDPGAAAGAPGAAATVARVGGPDLARSGAPVYTADTPASRLAVLFDGVDDAYSTGAGAAMTATDNFGIELLARHDGANVGAAIIAYVGDTSTSGYGIIRVGGTYQGLFGGVTFLGSAPATGAWTHLALVREGGITTLYVDGVASGSTAAAPNPVVGMTHVGANHLGREYFDGAIDNVRFFTFAPGAFDPATDLGFASLAATPASIDFGTQRVGTSSAAAAVTLSNPGSQPLEVSGLAAPTGGFARSGGSCAAVPFTLAPAASCTLEYTYAPTAAGAASTTIVLTSDGISTPDTITLQGVGVEPLVTIAPDPLQFGDQPVGTTSAPAAVTVQNTGSDTLSVSGISASAGPFALVGGTCAAAPFTLAPSASCTLSYTFSPTAVGAASQAITVTSDASSSPDSFELVGNGVQSAIALSPASIDFGTQPEDTTSQATATVSNTGTSQLDVSAISVPVGSFALVGGTCGSAPFVVPAGASCTLVFAFSPGSAGAASASVSIASNAPGSPTVLLLQGRATLTPLAQPQLVPALHPWTLILLGGLVSVLAAAGIRRS